MWLICSEPTDTLRGPFVGGVGIWGPLRPFFGKPSSEW